ncbi:hypothetical protein Tco_0915690 [Tanacetum coccineum]
MVNTHHKEVLNASTSKGVEPSASDAEHDDNDNGSSSGFEGLNYGGFTEEETKALRSVIPYYISQTTNNLKEVIKMDLEEFRKGGTISDNRNDMTTYRDFTACDVPKFDGALDLISNFKDFDGGYVTFGGGANGGRITGKGTIKTNKLDFDDVYFVKELKFNLFSVSQMCDKKNYVLFTDSECLVLSPNFKLPDENQILLKIRYEKHSS